MNTVLGIDLGGSSTKLAALDASGKLLCAAQGPCIADIRPLEEAVSAFMRENGISREQVEAVAMTGVGAASVSGGVCGMRVKRVSEFEAIARGALAMSGLRTALVASVGTGTAFVLASESEARHLGGSAMGGGTIVGLAEKTVGETDMEALSALAEKGDLGRVDLLMADIGTAPNLPPEATAANFGKTGISAAPADIAMGLMNLVFQNIATMAVFLCRGTSAQDIVVTGTAARTKQAKAIVDAVGGLYGVNFVIPRDPAFATATGAALLAIE